VCYRDTTIRIKVLDRIVIGDNRYFGFAGAGLTEQHKSDLLSLKEGRRN
jgi:hypothetical protein